MTVNDHVVEMLKQTGKVQKSIFVKNVCSFNSVAKQSVYTVISKLVSIGEIIDEDGFIYLSKPKSSKLNVNVNVHVGGGIRRKRSDVREAVLKFVSSKASQRYTSVQISKYLGLPKSSVFKVLISLISEGFVKKEGKGKNVVYYYSIQSENKDFPELLCLSEKEMKILSILVEMEIENHNVRMNDLMSIRNKLAA